MQVLEKFLKYIKINTQSDIHSKDFPSTIGQVKFANLLYKELEELGLKIDIKNGYLYAKLGASSGCEDIDSIGFISHLDTFHNINGNNINPQINYNYQCEDIRLISSDLVLSPKDYPELYNKRNETLITTDGSSLLGADDKAGIAEIIEALSIIIENDLPHGEICVAFTPDEEINNDLRDFDLELFNAKYAYTVDGTNINNINYENFSAVNASVKFKGVYAHTGHAKNKMVNSQELAMIFNNKIPQQEKPEHTEKYEGFYHLVSIIGNVEETTCVYFLRDFKNNKIEEKIKLFQSISNELNETFGDNSCSVSFKKLADNMNEFVLQNKKVLDVAIEALKNNNLKPSVIPTRGGTDGVKLCKIGLPCVNIGTGAMNIHSLYECITKESMEKNVENILNIVSIFTKELNKNDEIKKNRKQS